MKLTSPPQSQQSDMLETQSWKKIENFRMHSFAWHKMSWNKMSSELLTLSSLTRSPRQIKLLSLNSSLKSKLSPYSSTWIKIAHKISKINTQVCDFWPKMSSILKKCPLAPCAAFSSSVETQPIPDTTVHYVNEKYPLPR